MKSIKIVHFADAHLGMENYGKLDPHTGLNSRLNDFTKSLDRIVEYVLKNNIDLVIFAGDAYKTREPSPTFQREFAQRIYKIATAQIPVVMIVGNHDFPNALGKADTLEIFPTLAVPNIHIFQKDELKIIETQNGQIQVAGLPWYTRGQLLSKTEMLQKDSDGLNRLATQRLVEKIKFLSAKINPKMPAILAAHTTVEKAAYGSERQVMVGNELLVPLEIFKNSKFDAVFLGHLHKFQQILARPPVAYSGSIERVDFGEEHEDKGFVAGKLTPKNGRYDVNLEFIKLPVRPFTSIRAKIKTEDEEPTQVVIREIKKHNLKESVVKIIIEVPEEKSLEIHEGALREALKDADFIAGITKEIRKGERSQIKEGFSDEFLNLDKIGLLEKYLKSKKVPKSRVQILKKETEKLLEETFV